MIAASTTSSSRLLQSTAWAERLDAVLLRREDSWWSSPIARSHAHALRRLFDDIGASAVLCTEGRPALCVLDARNRAAAEIELLRHGLWNLGATTLLLVETSNDVQLFSTLVKPTRSDTQGHHARLSNETIKDLEIAALALRLRQLIRRIETGAIYRDDASLFNPLQTVDRDLLDNLKEARDLICPQRTKVGYQHAHALVGRFFFSCYLLDRKIIGPPYLGEKGLPLANDMLALLSGARSRGAILVKLFNALHQDFNGSLFGDPFPVGGVQDDEAEILLRLLAGEDLKSGQLGLGFKLYDFSYVPIEFISSIYEEFLGAEAAVDAKAAAEKSEEAADEDPDDDDDPDSAPTYNAQRSSGAYYTPPRLAELAVDVATDGWSTLLDKRCLDPACGSGVFLVILFIRMAEEWRRRNPRASTAERYQGLLSLLETNLYGMDLQLTACRVACFSLYLALLDQMDPKEIIELRAALELSSRKKILPPILWEGTTDKPPRTFNTVRELDFFQLGASRDFDLVVGNPPWVSRKPSQEAEAWLFSAKNPYSTRVLASSVRKKNPRKSKVVSKTLTGQARSLVRKTLFPEREVACAFMWKASQHLTARGRVCQVLPSRVFLGNKKNDFQAEWLEQHRLESVWLLADYRHVLFSAAACPCLIARYHPRAVNEPLDDFEFITPKVELLDPRHALLPVLPEDQKTISQAKLLAAAQGGCAAAMWKRNHWGTPRDERLLSRLLKWPRLARIAVRPPPPDEDRGKKGKKGLLKRTKKQQPPPLRDWVRGQGFQPKTKSTEDTIPIFWDKDALFLTAHSPTDRLILLKSQVGAIGKLYKDGLHRKRNPRLYLAPMLLVNKACTKFFFSDFDVLFQDDFQSICGPSRDEAELLFLTAYFSSPLAEYILFHTAATIGIEREIARLTEMVELPFPLPEDMPDPEGARRIIKNSAVCLRQLRTDLENPGNLLRHDQLVSDARGTLDGLVAQYFGLCEWEQELITDTVKVFRPSATPRLFDGDNLFTAKSSTPENREEYVSTLTRIFRGWSRTRQHLQVVGHTAPRAGLVLVTFGIGPQEIKYKEQVAEERVERVIRAIRDASTDESGVVFRRLRGFAFYEDDRVHLLKPLNRRHWTRTAALNDADEIIAQMMEDGGWGA